LKPSIPKISSKENNKRAMILIIASPNAGHLSTAYFSTLLEYRRTIA
jgi:hypothetical protein